MIDAALIQGQDILRPLYRVEALRQGRRGDAALEARVVAVKAFQHQRFLRSYQDLLAQPAHAPAARFFLDDLYGPGDFTKRDAQFARIVPALVRLFPPEIVATVATLAELHALSEELDDGMARHIEGLPLMLTAYRLAWQRTGSPAHRQHQIDLMLQVGRALAKFTRSPVLRGSLRVMRTPARLAGLSALQGFLERGFDTFSRLPNAESFLQLIADRERAISAWLYSEQDLQTAPPGIC